MEQSLEKWLERACLTVIMASGLRQWDARLTCIHASVGQSTGVVVSHLHQMCRKGSQVLRQCLAQHMQCSLQGTRDSQKASTTPGSAHAVQSAGNKGQSFTLFPPRMRTCPKPHLPILRIYHFCICWQSGPDNWSNTWWTEVKQNIMVVYIHPRHCSDRHDRQLQGLRQ